MPLYQLDDLIPRIDPSAYVADSADIIGNVTLEAGVSIWSHVSIRGNNNAILIRRGTNIQEGSVLHVDEGCPWRSARTSPWATRPCCMAAPSTKAPWSACRPSC